MIDYGIIDTKLYPNLEEKLRTIKEDLVWMHDWDNPFALSEALKKWINDYNTDYPHQSLNNMTPREYFETFNQEIKEPDSILKNAC